MKPLRIATWNLRRPRRSRPRKAAIPQDSPRAIDADICILTETNSIVTPGSKYTSVESWRIPNPNVHSDGESRTTIWSRYEILRTIETHADDTAVCVEVRLPAGPMIVYGTVLPYHSAGTKYTYASGGMEITGKRNWQWHYESIEGQDRARITPLPCCPPTFRLGNYRLLMRCGVWYPVMLA